MKPGLLFKNCLGVSPIGEESKLLAMHSAKQKGKSALDVGCGTGIVAITLQAEGWDCTGIDISYAAVECSKKNAKLNNMKISFKKSDLFENVEGKFDLIVFNPPYGNSKKFSSFLELVKSFFPRENPLLSKITYFLIKEKRRQLIRRFLNQAGRHLKKNGRIIMVFHKSELRTFDIDPKILDKHADLRIVMIEKNL